MRSRNTRRIVVGLMVLAILISGYACPANLDKIHADDLPPLYLEYHLPFIAK